MPSNPYKEQQKAFSEVRKQLLNIPPEGINKHLLLTEVLAHYAVSKNAVVDYIDTFVLGKVIVDDEGVLHGK